MQIRGAGPDAVQGGRYVSAWIGHDFGGSNWSVLARRVAGASRGLYEPFVQAVRESGTTGVVMAGDRSEGKLLADVYARPLPPGRAQLIRRGRPPQLIQTAFREDGQP